MGAEDEKERISAEIIRSGAVSPSEPILPVVNPAIISEKKIDPPASSKIHPAFYVTTWIALSSSIIIFNKWILDDGGFHYPIILTCWHLTFATIMTQIMARTTTLLDGRKTVKMTGRIYIRAILPIGAFFSLSLICGNMTYLYLGVAFIQMLKATTPVAVLLAGWGLGTEKPNLNNLFKVSFIVIGIIIASFGEIEFVLIGFLFQLGGIVFEALRLVMVQKLLSSAEYKMDPLVSLYYFAPICAVMNFCVAAVVEIPAIKLKEIYNVGLLILLANAVIAFALNVSVVFLVKIRSMDCIGRTSSLVLTLCGVLKDILLVFASIAIWGKPVTGLQFFGYSIALAGLVYFKLGGDTIKAKFSDAGRAWTDYGVRHPALRKVIVFTGMVIVTLILLVGLAPSVGYDSKYLSSVYPQSRIPVTRSMDGMEESEQTAEDKDLPPQQLFERLSYLSGYTWDTSLAPFHSSYDNWHVFGIQHIVGDRSTTNATSAPNAGAPSESSKSSPKINPRPSPRHFNTSSDALTDLASATTDQDRSFIPVIARVSAHLLRLEREYQLGKTFIQTSDPDCRHTVRLIGLARLPARQNDPGPLAVEIFESPGRNYLRDLVDLGPAWYVSQQQSLQGVADVQNVYDPERQSKISLATFLDFAIGASECLELLHHGLKVVHGELRADAFHFNSDTGVVKLVNFGSGPRSFEYAGGLTSSGWSTMSRQKGIKTRLMFIAPEQTGRMSAEPDYRTDIYSLGILFWTMLAGEPVFDGLSAIDIMQAVLGKRVPPISNIRFDVPDVLSAIIQRMTQKQIDDRYHSSSGVRHDLAELKRILGEGDSEALMSFNIGSKDVSSSFVLPTTILGRSQEQKRIVQAMERVASKQQQGMNQADSRRMNSITSTTASTNSEHNDNLEAATRSSDVSSQEVKYEDAASATDPNSLAVAYEQRSFANGVQHPDAVTATEKPPLETTASKDSVATVVTMDSHTSTATRSSYRNKSSGTPAARKSAKYRYGSRRRCEVVTVYGQAGLGKSSLIQTTQSDIRKLGYFASAKFDPARKVPFETMLRAMSSLFRQIFSESDINTPYHSQIRSNIRSIWPSLCGMLDVPENLLSVEGHGSSRLPLGHPVNKALHVENGGVDTSSSLSPSVSSSSHSGSHSMLDFLRGGSSAYSSKYMSIFIDVIRILTTSKMICLCFDDLQFADEESVDLICNMISRKLGLVIIFTCRDTEQLPHAIRSILDSGIANLTAITLRPLNEREVIDYVAATLSRPDDYVHSLAIVCLEKTNGNPFYLKQMLEVCYRKGCLWYSWKDSAWEYNLDRIFAEFESDMYGDQLNTSFILKRLQDLPPTSRAILAWGSLLGNTFSFSLVQKLLSGAFDHVDDALNQTAANNRKGATVTSPQLTETAVEGLQANLQAYILVPTIDEDHFRFGPPKGLKDDTLMKYSSPDSRSLHAKAQHICQAERLIKDRVQHRSRYRQVLSEAAQRAIDSGARPTALQYYNACLNLMQAQPWGDGEDTYYDETLDVYTRTAQLCWHQGLLERAMRLASQALEATKVPSDRAQVWIITSRLLSQQGDIAGAFQALKTCMIELGVDWDRSLTLDELDRQYDDLKKRVQQADEANVLLKPLIEDPAHATLGAILAEAISAAFWSDSTMFYQVASTMLHRHMIQEASFSQMGLGFCYFAMIAVVRKSDIPFAIQCQDIGQRMLEHHKDSYTYGRALALRAMFTDGFRIPIRDHIPIFEESIQHAQVAGDKHTYLFTTGLIASCRLYQGDDMTEIENYCVFAAEDFGDWSRDVRGGTYLTAIRQTSRALQGKTYLQSAENVFSDAEHDSAEYLQYIVDHASNPERPRDIYNSLMMIPLYLYGFYDKAIEVGFATSQSIHQLWSIRNNRLNLFYLSLSLIAKIRDNRMSYETTGLLDQVREFKSQIDAWQTESSVNYLMWSLLIEAEVADLIQKYHEATICYEAAIDHTQINDFMLDQALAFELQGEFFMRRGSKRAARSLMLDAVGTYARIGAFGKADQLRAKHEWLLSNALNIRSVDAEAQTNSEIGNASFTLKEPQHQQRESGDSDGDRMNEWISPKGTSVPGAMEKGGRTITDVSGLGLDVLDLQSIMEFNQAISSELQIDRLLGKMTEIILESAGAQADLACVVIEGEGGWNVAAIGTADGIKAESVPLSEVEDETQKQVLLYTMRFKETVFVHNILHDDRFCNTLASKSVISLPILRGEDLLGVLYLEGQPNSFTDRNVGVLQLFCNQVSISIFNALLFKKIHKVSAANASMIESQKLALAKARDAELKAKVAEAEAMRSVREKEEAAKAKSMFLANVSHELRTPLNGVIGMSELLKGTQLNSEQEGYTDSIKVCADTLLTVINDILDFSKLEAGKLSLFSVPMNLRGTIIEVVRALSLTNAKKGLKTIEDLDLDENLLVMGDPVRIHQIFMNLLSNSYKFTAEGSITIKARTESEDSKTLKVTCSIIDTGIGVTQEQVSRLFKPFSQADSSTQRSYGGSGLGLSICKALISVLNGKIWLESQLGVGTTVSFTLSFAKAQKAAKANEKARPVSEPDPMATWSSDADGSKSQLASFIDLSKVPRDKLRICIAEDNPINQKIAVSFVTKLGFKSEAFSDGLQAVEALRRRSADKNPFHLVLMDVQMPVLDGYDATRLIRKDADPTVRRVLVIAMTASAIRGDREKCIDAGMNNYLAKPVRANVLKQMLESYLNQDPKMMVTLEQTATEVAQDAIAQVAKADLTKRIAATRTASYEAAAKSMSSPSAAAKATNGTTFKGKNAERPELSPRKNSKTGKSFTKSKESRSKAADSSLVRKSSIQTKNSATEAAETSPAQGAKIGPAEEDDTLEWPSFMRRPNITRGISSSNDSQKTVTGPAHGDEDDEVEWPSSVKKNR
ncbi:MAG: hypothetical protein Q9213_004209 [Squamulea squamosa]